MDDLALLSYGITFCFVVYTTLFLISLFALINVIVSLMTNLGVQLRKEGRRNEYERHKLQALNQRQKMVFSPFFLALLFINLCIFVYMVGSTA